jgi:hypothetical protein
LLEVVELAGVVGISCLKVHCYCLVKPLVKLQSAVRRLGFRVQGAVHPCENDAIGNMFFLALLEQGSDAGVQKGRPQASSSSSGKPSEAAAKGPEAARKTELRADAPPFKPGAAGYYLPL